MQTHGILINRGRSNQGIADVHLAKERAEEEKRKRQEEKEAKKKEEELRKIEEQLRGVHKGARGEVRVNPENSPEVAYKYIENNEIILPKFNKNDLNLKFKKNKNGLKKLIEKTYYSKLNFEDPKPLTGGNLISKKNFSKNPNYQLPIADKIRIPKSAPLIPDKKTPASKLSQKMRDYLIGLGLAGAMLMGTGTVAGTDAYKKDELNYDSILDPKKEDN